MKYGIKRNHSPCKAVKFIRWRPFPPNVSFQTPEDLLRFQRGKYGYLFPLFIEVHVGRGQPLQASGNGQAQDLTLALSFILEQHKFPENRFMPFVWPSQFQSVITLYKKLWADCVLPLGHLGFKKEKRDSLGPDENLRDRCRQQLLGFCLFCFQAAARKNQSLHQIRWDEMT